ncbi:EAL domain-containing protein [Alcaligenaceae bacterium SJ-26]|nr:EAL domain-containing protein [Alcaligenaceae bacterium SJ-26]
MKQNEKGLSEMRSMVNGIVDSMPFAMLLTDQDGIITYTNTYASRLFGYELEQLHGQSIDVLIPSRSRPRHEGMRRSFMDNPVSRVMGASREVRGRRKDGSELAVEVGLNALPVDGETWVMVSVYDASARRQAQNEAAKAQHLAQAMIEAAPFSIIATDLSGTIVSMNPTSEKMLWHKAADLVGRVNLLQIHDGEEIRLRIQELSHAQIDNAGPQDFSLFVAYASHARGSGQEWMYVRRDGSKFPVQLTLSALKDANEGVSGFLAMAFDISERKRADEYIQHIAHHDILTGLPNRVLMQDRLDTALRRISRYGNSVGVLLIDLDNFKRINDSLGHHIGDHLLAQVAERLRKAVRESDTVARLGGDEFIVVLPDIGSLDNARRLAVKLLARLGMPIRVNEYEFRITASLGISLAPDHATDSAALMMYADMAMYEAKRRGRSQCQAFSQEMAQRVARHHELEQALETAIDRNQFWLAYQPQYDVATGKVVALEALLRWQHPVWGSVGPDQFIPIAESSGLIVPIGAWVMRRACEEIGQVRAVLGEPELRIAINVSPHQLIHEDFLASLNDTLQECDADPRLIELEITETSLMDSVEDVLPILTQLRERGVSIAIDDFGTGFSSLSYLIRFPVQRLKIDRVFINEIEQADSQATVVSAIIAMAHKLGLEVLAEGVETERQHHWLQRQKCDQAQGFLLGRPMSCADLIDSLQIQRSLRLN